MYRLLRSFPLTIFALASLLAPAASGAGGLQEAPHPATSSVFSFYDRCCQATWFNGGLQQQESQLPCPGDESDDRGFVRPLGAGYTLETDQPAKHAIETHPRWVNDGYIYGVFNLQSLGLTLQAGDHFVSEVGFLKGAAAGEVRFSLWYDSKPTQPGGETLLAEKQDQHDGKLRQIEVDLSGYASVSGALLLRVDALGSSGQDWAVWVDPRIERQPTPTPKSTSTEAPPTIPPTLTLTPTLAETPQPPPSPTTTPAPLDDTPPTFFSGPAADQQAQDSARICWTTDDPTTGRVLYDSRAGKLGFTLEDQQPTQDHCLTLTNLQPNTAYQFVVQAQDQAGNGTASRQLHFLTLSPPDDEGPVLELFTPETLSGIAQLGIDAVDNIALDRVIFWMDDVLLWTDFSFPFEWDLDTRRLDDGDHVLTVQVFDAAGNVRELTRQISIENRLAAERSPVEVTIENPASGAEVSGVVEIRAEITHKNDIGIETAVIEIDGRDVHRVPYLTPLPGDRMDRERIDSEGKVTLRYMWDTRDYAEGQTIVVEVQAWDAFENSGHAGIRVVKAEEPPLFEIERSVTREGHFFHVDLTVHNMGTNERQNAYDVIIEDVSRDYQAVTGAAHSSYSYERSTATVWQWFEALPAGSSVTISYDLVPVLLDPMDDDYTIGTTTHISYSDAEDHENVMDLADPFIPGDYTALPHPRLPEEIGEVYASVNFIVITDPGRLFNAFDEDDVNGLLSSLATFAIEKQAVLGYRRPGENWYSGAAVKDNLGYTGMGYSGDWINRLNDAFSHEGYVLLVGETDIIPSFDLSGFNVTIGGTVHDMVRDSDLPYADIWAEDGWPELRVGRALGRSPRELAEPIRTSLGVELGRMGFDRSDALLVTGHEGTWEGFINRANLITENMESHGIEVEAVHTEYYSTLEQLLREALVIRGDYECTGLPGHVENGTPCPKTHPPTALADLQSLITKAQAEAVEADRRGIEGTYDTSYSSICDAADAAALLIKQAAVDKDLIYWGGHGNPGSWGWALDNFVSGTCSSATEMYIGGADEPSITPLSFGLSAPVIVASSCLTGNYRGGDAFSRAMLNRQAAVYIGATEVSPSGYLIGIEFFDQFLEGSPTVGEALTAVKRDRIRSSQMWRFVCYEYNLYGDPTFGGR